MATLRKRKTLANDPNHPQSLKRKHLSTNYIGQDSSKTDVCCFIQHLLQRVSEQVAINQRYSQGTVRLLGQINAMDEGYFTVEDVATQQPLCMPDEQPISEGRVVIGKAHPQTRLKRTAIKRTEVSSELSLLPPIDRKNSNAEPNLRERQNLVHRMKKECSVIRNSKYLSSSKPLGETRVCFQQADGPQASVFRLSLFKKAQVGHASAFSKIDGMMRNGGKLVTRLKKSKDFIEKIDPTNSICVSERRQSLCKPGHRSSISNVYRQGYLLEESIVVKQTHFTEISTLMNPLREISNRKPICPNAEQQRSNRMMNVLSERYREQLRLRLERSFHSGPKTRLSPSASTSHAGLPSHHLPRLSQR